MGILLHCTSAHCVHDLCLQRPEEDIRSPVTRAADGWEPPCRCWELILDTLEDQWVLLTAEPPPQSLDLLLLDLSSVCDSRDCFILGTLDHSDFLFRGCLLPDYWILNASNFCSQGLLWVLPSKHTVLTGWKSGSLGSPPLESRDTGTTMQILDAIWHPTELWSTEAVGPLM